MLFVLLLPGLSVMPGTGQAGTRSRSPYFPETGPAAIRQRMLDLERASVVMSIAAEPGEEDLPTLAGLRLEHGVKVVSVYVASGAGTPGQLKGETLAQTAVTRKREACEATQVIGAQSYFLDFPDYGHVPSISLLETAWSRDTVVARCDEAIRMFRPDLILVSRDFRASSGDSVREELIRRVVLRSVRSASTTGERDTRWRVRAVYIEDEIPGGTVNIGVDTRLPLWKQSAREIAEKAYRAYASLALQIRLWDPPADRRYRKVTTGGRGTSRSLLNDLTYNSGPLTTIAPLIRDIGDAARRNKRDDALRIIQHTSAVIDQLVQQQGSRLDQRDERILAQWKNGMEDLRCSLLNVRVGFSASDSILAPQQVFYLRFSSVKGNVPAGQTEIIFPSAMKGDWIINGKGLYRFPLTFPAEFTIVTPEKMSWDLPPTVNGISSHRCTTTFPFIVFRKDTVGARSFAYRGEVAFDTGPVRTVEILTPNVRVTDGERLVLSLQNISRDPLKGQAYVKDSVAHESRVSFAFSRKDQIVVDTLPLRWSSEVRDGNYPVQLFIGGNAVGQFRARKFAVHVDSSVTVGLISTMEASPLEEALRRMHAPYRIVTEDGVKRGDLEGVGALLADRDCFALGPGYRAGADSLVAWVGRGGHLILLPQRLPDTLRVLREFQFPASSISPDAPVVADSGTMLMVKPNRISEDDWKGWAISRATEAVRVSGEMNGSVLLRSTESNMPLVVTAKVGNGMITAVALDLEHQLQLLHPGAFRLLANLLSRQDR